MALLIDTTRPLRRPDELLALVVAIVGASPNDEPDWLEWKQAMDLGHKATQGPLPELSSAWPTAPSPPLSATLAGAATS
jgi:hypothetical protein